MKFFKKYWVASVLCGIVIVYFFTRLYNLTTLPIFTDEAIYIRWSQIARDDAAWQFISLTDGKQPMFVWLAMFLFNFIRDPMLAGRMVSVIAGFFSTIGIFFLGKELFKNTKIGLLSSLLYVVYPFSLVYDRLALYDSLVAMFVVWSLYVTVLLIRHIRLYLGILLGVVIGGGMLTKTSANFALILLPFSLLLFPLRKFNKTKFLKWILFAGIAFIIANILYNILRLSPFFHIIGEKNLTFIYSFNEWIRSPFAYVFGNVRGLGGWLIDYATIPFLILVIAAFFISKKYTQEKTLLLLWFIIPFLSLAFFGKVIYPRFILFMTMPLLVLGAFSLFYLQQKSVNSGFKIFTFLVFTTMFFITDYFVLTNFSRASIPQADREQFITGWPAGGGVKETITYLQNKAKTEKIYVGTEGTFGLMPYALEMYLYKDPNIKITGFWPINDAPPKELLEASKKMPTYVVFYQPCPSCKIIGEAPPTWPVTKVFQVKKPGNNTFYTLYQFKPQ